MADHLLSLDEYLDLPEDTSRRFELAAGIMQVSPNPVPHHQRVMMRLGQQLDDHLPIGWEAIHQVDVVIESRHPPTVRVPDLIVMSLQRLKDEPPYLSAADVVLAIEVVSPGSREMDNATKLYEYARGGIPHYWIVDPDRGPTLTAFERDGGAGYRRFDTATGRYQTERPFPLDINIKALVEY